MNAGLFIYFPRDPGQNIYFKVFDGQDIHFKKLPAPLSESTVRPLTKRDQFQPFPNGTDRHTKHLAMPHGLWPIFFIICAELSFVRCINSAKAGLWSSDITPPLINVSF